LTSYTEVTFPLKTTPLAKKLDCAVMGPTEEAYDQNTPYRGTDHRGVEGPQAGVSVQDLCRKHGISDATFYKWRTKYAGLDVSDVKKLRQLEDENRRLKQMVAEQALDIQALKAITAKTGTAQGEEGGGTGCRRTLWAQPAAGVPVSGPGSEHAAVPQSATGRLRTSDEDPRDCRDQTALWVSPDLCAVATGRLEDESQDG
jgi:putative transposase